MIENAVTQDTLIEYDDHRDTQDTDFIMPTTIGADDSRHLFSYFGIFLTYITPRDLTVGMNSCVILIICDIFFQLLFEQLHTISIDNQFVFDFCVCQLIAF